MLQLGSDGPGELRKLWNADEVSCAQAKKQKPTLRRFWCVLHLIAVTASDCIFTNTIEKRTTC